MSDERTHVPEPGDLDAAAPPWDYNPSAWSQRLPICVLALVGFAISAYLSLFEWGLIESVWDPVFGTGTETVLTSDVAHGLHRWFGIPDGALGAIAYLGDAVLGLAGSTRRWQYRPWMVILFGIDVIPLGAVSGVLVLLQATLVGAWCFLCLVSAAISMTLIYFAYDEVWSSLVYLRRVWRHTGSAREVWNVFWGRYSAAGEAVLRAEV
ncbi:MAG: vitamin K epoxide reductase family protein [Vicinamibacterales bacterium]